MKIVVLDGHTLNPGDLSWQALEKYGEVKVYERTPHEQELILERIGDAEAIIINKIPITKEIIQALPQLKYIGVSATGYNVVDVTAATAKKITVTNIPSYGTQAVAQFTFALLLEVTSFVGQHNQSVQAGDWQKSVDFTYWQAPLIELSGKTIGLIGYGAISQAVAKIAQAFNMTVLYYNHREKKPVNVGDRQVSLAELYQQADIISLHVPQTTETAAMINAAAINKMKEGVIIINTARGGLLDEAAVAEALNQEKIGALAVDVVSKEPITADNPLLKAKNTVITPHIAWAPTETRQRLMNILVENLASFDCGKIENSVN